MEEKWIGLSRYLSLMFLLAILAVSCSMPRMVVMRDALTASEHNDLGVVYEKKGLSDLAEKEYRKAMEKDRSWYLPLFNLGNLNYSKGNLVMAEQYYRRSLTLDRENTDVMNNLASLLHEFGLDHEALALINRALSKERKPEYLDTYDRIIGEQPGDDVDEEGAAGPD